MGAHRRKETTAQRLRAQKDKRAHELARELFWLKLVLLDFDSMTRLVAAIAGTSAQRADILEARAKKKAQMIARTKEIECDPDYIVFEPYGVR